MIDRRLVEYIETNIKKGYSPDSIKHVLINEGFTKENIEGIFNFINQKRNLNNNNINNNNNNNNDNNNYNKINNHSSNNKKYLYVIIPTILILIIVSFFLFNNNMKTISEDEIIQGAVINLKEDKIVQFNFNQEKHSIFLEQITNNSVTINIHSNPIQVKIGIGEEKKINLNNNYYYDLKIKLNNIINEEPELFLKKINELMCNESWNCSEWNNCTSENIQTRICTDLNDCGSNINKPNTNQECICISDWKCDDWNNCSENGNQTRTCTDLNNCGTNESKPNLIQECEYVEPCYENWECTDWNNCSENENQIRTCIDLNDCGTNNNKPTLIQECEYIAPCKQFWECEDWSICNENGYQIMNCIDLNYCDVNNYIMNYTKECTCDEDWGCEDWSICSEDGNQTRICTDLNNCGTNESIPNLIQECEYEETYPVNNPETILDCYNEDLSEILCSPEKTIEFTTTFETRLETCVISEGTFALGFEPLFGIFRGYEIQSEQNETCIVKFWFLENEIIEPSLLNKNMICEYKLNQRNLEEVNNCVEECCSGELIEAMNELFND